MRAAGSWQITWPTRMHKRESQLSKKRGNPPGPIQTKSYFRYIFYYQLLSFTKYSFSFKALISRKCWFRSRWIGLEIPVSHRKYVISGTPVQIKWSFFYNLPTVYFNCLELSTILAKIFRRFFHVQWRNFLLEVCGSSWIIFLWTISPTPKRNPLNWTEWHAIQMEKRNCWRGCVTWMSIAKQKRREKHELHST